MNSKKTLCLFTASYPYGLGEDYIHNELKVISKKFDLIYIFPADIKPTIRSVEPNIIVVNYPGISKNRKLLLLKNVFNIAQLIIFEIIHNRKRCILINKIRYYLDTTVGYVDKYLFLSTKINELKLNNSLFYSFWMHDWASVLAIAKANRKINGFVTRVNGFDFREDSAPNGFIFPRQFQLHHVNKVVAVSEYAFQQLCYNYPSYENRFIISKLGVFDHGINPNNQSDCFTIVSCSTLTYIKRVDYIPIILNQIKKNIRWIHFGDGPEKEKIEAECLKLSSNISFELRGQTNNDDIIEFYKSSHVDLFIQLSSTEGGVPVALQEAISFGIPVVATKAGGIPEIINDQNGWLVDVEINVNEIASIIENEIIKYPELLKNKRRKSRELFKDSFDANNNYNAFFQILCSK
jgi:glycosyltransferase involved in cell wall biosynthesis